MGRKRANGEGTIYRLPNGKWKAVVCDARAKDGKLVRRSRTADSHAGARAKLDELRDEPSGDSRSLTVAAYLNRWLDDSVKPNLADNTYRNYKQQCDTHIIPRLGTLKLCKLSALHVQRFVADMLRDAVPPATRVYVFRVLRNALTRADRLDLIAANPCGKVDPPRHRRKEIKPFTSAEVKMILAAVEKQPLYGFYLLAFSTGMRQGELCGLWWEDIDEQKGILRVRRQLVYGTGPGKFAEPKTKHSLRTIELSESCQAALTARKRWAMKNGFASNKLVFCNSIGTPVNPRTFSRNTWGPLLKRLGLEHRGFHHARHSYASLSLSDGVPINIVSGILGHANSSITLTLYAHAMPSMQKLSTDSMSRLIG
jgi:integrase